MQVGAFADQRNGFTVGHTEGRPDNQAAKRHPGRQGHLARPAKMAAVFLFKGVPIDRIRQAYPTVLPGQFPMVGGQIVIDAQLVFAGAVQS